MRPVLHRSAQPISLTEFTDALRATTPPRFPRARSLEHRQVGLAISGGVDSMALAFLCGRLRTHDPWFRIADTPVGGFTAFVVNHCLRPNSDVEAENVASVVQSLGHRAIVCSLAGLLDPAAPPSALETAARRYRYRRIGSELALRHMASLLLAHHADDQHETILLRLLTGYGLNGGIRGLRGMQPAVDLPECRGMYGAHRSGMLQELRLRRPYVRFAPTRGERRRMRSALVHDIVGEDLSLDPGPDLDGPDPLEAFWLSCQSSIVAQPPLPVPLDTESLGVLAYRPFLFFTKDRLVATCEANNVRWFEDYTNADPSLTMRNAVRALVRHHHLPEALQRPAILRLAARCHAESSGLEAEAIRLAARSQTIHRFSTNAGTAVVRLPRIVPRVRRRPVHSRALSAAYAAVELAHRRRRWRAIAALIVRELLDLVTPEPNLTPVSQLQTVIDTLFPELAEQPTQTPKAFNICGVHFMPGHVTKTRATQTATATSFSLSFPSSPSSPSSPIPTSPITWLLSRAPYPATPSSARPAILYHSRGIMHRVDAAPEQWKWPNWTRRSLYDGRFWIRLCSRLPNVVDLRPFAVEHAKALRDALGPAGAAALQAALKLHAPGKSRYTLPALYALGDVSWITESREYWPVMDHCSDDTMALRRRVWEEQQMATDNAPRLVALPTLGIFLPGIENFLHCETSYRKVNTDLLGRCGVEPWAWPGAVT